MENYIFASIGSWHSKIYRQKIKALNGAWTYIDNPRQLTLEKIKEKNPKYIFFPHWRWKVPDEIVNNYNCVCFHETNLPFGRGGSPIQNLIQRGHKDTVICAIKMTPHLDAGPIYNKKKLSLKGSAQDIYARSSRIVFTMIKEILEKEITPRPQRGKAVYFRRRKPAESRIKRSKNTLEKLYDFIRMLDAEGYPHAFIEYGPFRVEFTKALLKKNILAAEAKIILK